MSRLRNSKHEHFAQDVALGKPIEDAYQAAGFKPDRRNAIRLRDRKDVASRIDAILTQRVHEQGKAEERAIERVAISKAWILDKLRENVERAMTATPVMRDGKPTGEFTYNGTVANKALELLGREIGMFISRTETGKPGDFTALSNVELADRLVDELVRGGVPADVARAFARVQLERVEPQA